MANRKAFFKRRTERAIERLNSSCAYTNKDLVQRINDLDPSEDSLVIRARVLPHRFFGGCVGSEASRKAYKHGETVNLEYPQTKTAACESPLIPLKIRERALKELEEMPQEKINFVGLSARPSFGDRTRRVQHFSSLVEGIKLFGYAENLTGGIDVEIYADSKRVAREGASVVVGVPSRSKNKSRYTFRLLHVPVVRNNANLAAVQLLKPAIVFDEFGEPLRGRTEHDDYTIRYTWEDESEGSNQILYQPQDVAAYLGIVKSELENHNMTPMEMNPFMLTSKHGAEFYKKLDNNVLIFDPSKKKTKTNPRQLRRLHLAEKDVLFCRGIGHFGHDDFAFWEPARDGRLKDYDWSFGG